MSKNYNVVPGAEPNSDAVVPLNDDDGRPGIVFRSAHSDPDASDLPLPDSTEKVKFYAPKQRDPNAKEPESLPMIGVGQGLPPQLQPLKDDSPTPYRDVVEPVDRPAKPQRASPQKSPQQSGGYIPAVQQTGDQEQYSLCDEVQLAVHGSGPQVYLIFSLCNLIFCPVFGVLGLLCSLTALRHFRAGNNAEGKEKASMSFYLNWIGVVTTLTIILVIVIVNVLPHKVLLV
ncbi:uncharacterized protein LOC141899458 isoform X2 [Tubulanus polymorphus]|uniref:uncharacterized protein LOC141899458 isoform X2 n=1 Tax=Tubulanus polymorphus TaxID=672921 RepID=UPI003DA37C2D